MTASLFLSILPRSVLGVKRSTLQGASACLVLLTKGIVSDTGGSGINTHWHQMCRLAW